MLNLLLESLVINDQRAFLYGILNCYKETVEVEGF